MKMKQLFLTLTTCLLLLGCSNSNRRPFSLQGGWTLSQVEYPVGKTDTFPQNGMTWLHIYDGDSTLMECQLIRTASAMVIQPSAQCGITLIDKGGGEKLYLEADNPKPLTVVDDTTIVIQSYGALYTWHRADANTQEWEDEIHNIITQDLQGGRTDYNRHYVLSAKERQQATFIHWLFFAIALLMLVFAQITYTNRKARQRLQRQLLQIQEEHEERPQPIRKAIETVEATFFASDEYHTLQHRLASGQRLKEEEWDGIEELLRKVYPGFSGQLRNLYEMSDLEYQVCVLTKLRIPPSSIASVLVRDISTISSVRSRLFKKVFGRKGGAREWDEFILSIGV